MALPTMEPFSLLKFWRIPGAEGSDHDFETDDNDSFFDLEFTVPGRDENKQNESRNVNISSSDSDEDSYSDLAEKIGINRSNFIESPTDVLRFRPNSKPQSPISFLRSPPKLRVFMLFKNSKFVKTVTSEKCSKVEDVPIFSLIARENSSRSDLRKQTSENASSKRFPKATVHKYLKLIKPLYARASRKHSENHKFSGKDEFITSSPSSSPTMAPVRSPRKQVEERRGSRQPALRVACKHLGKSRSASSTAGTVPAPARRDDSLLLQHDGIQSAILHCKTSYNSSRDFSVLSRSATGEKTRISI